MNNIIQSRRNFLADSKRLEDAVTAFIDLISTLANTDGSPVVLPKYALTRPYAQDLLGSLCEALREQGLSIKITEDAHEKLQQVMQ